MQSAFSWGTKVAGKCESKHWYACGADRRSVGHVITKFSGMGRFIYPWCSSGALRARSSAKTYSALSFDRINFFNMANLFLLSQKAFVMCYCFRAPIKTFFFDACQMTVKSCVLHLFPVPQTGRSHIINILLASFFRSVLQITDRVFFPSIYGPCASRLDHKSMEYSTDQKLG